MGFLFLVLYPVLLLLLLLPVLPPSHTHSLIHSLTHTHSHSLTLTLTHTITHSYSLGTPCVAGVGQCALLRGLMYALASLGAPPLLRGRRGTMCTAKGSDVRPGVPWGSASFTWQAWDNLHCQGVWCTPWRPFNLRLFCVAGVGQCALPRGLMYALASLGAPPLLRGNGSDVRPGVPWYCPSFAWQAWDNKHCQGVWCTPWRPLGLRRFCVAGKGQCALPRSLMYALASLGAPLLLRDRRGIMCIAKGLDKRPGRCGICIYSFTHLLTHVRTHARNHPLLYTHTQSLTPSLPHSPAPSFPLHLPSLHFISLHSLTHIHYYHHHHYVPAMFTSHRACRKS